MSTISARVDESVKNEAELIANEIGISLSTAINIFLKKFIAEKGFPFTVTLKAQRQDYIIDKEKLSHSIKQAIADTSNTGIARKFSYIDPESNQLITILRKEV